MRPRTVALALFVFSFATTKGSVETSRWSVKAGLGYEFISQRFFADSLSLSGADSLTLLTSLRTTYLDDIKAQLGVSFYPLQGPGSRRGELRAEITQTPNFARLRFGSDFRLGLGANNLDSRTEIDWRQRYHGAVDVGDNYITASSQTRLTLPIDENWSTWIQARGELIQFDSTSTIIFSHYRFGGKWGVTRSLGYLAQAGINLFALGRRVPDSTALDYLSWGAETDLTALMDHGELALLGRVERKDYHKANRADDYWRLETDGDGRWQFGDRWFVRSELAAELMLFSDSDQFNADYFRCRLAIMSGRRYGDWGLDLGPHIEFLKSTPSDVVAPEDYREMGLRTDIDYLKATGALLSIQTITGYRWLKKETDFQTSFAFERINALADLRIAGGLSCNVILSTEWEWHRQSSDNSTTVLLSTGLNYTF